jgi:hypothetical protein
MPSCLPRLLPPVTLSLCPCLPACLPACLAPACLQELRAKVYAELEATPDKGRQFAAAVRHLMKVQLSVLPPLLYSCQYCLGLRCCLAGCLPACTAGWLKEQLVAGALNCWPALPACAWACPPACSPVPGNLSVQLVQWPRWPLPASDACSLLLPLLAGWPPPLRRCSGRTVGQPGSKAPAPRRLWSAPLPRPLLAAIQQT